MDSDGLMKSRILPLLCLVGITALPLQAADAAAAIYATTITKSAIKIGNGSFALVKGTKLEVLGREGDQLIVKFRATQGKVPLAETDFPADAPVPQVTPAPAAPVAAAKAPVPAAPVPAAKPATPPALSVDGKPTTNYGKAVQKAKQVTEANKGTHVDPTKDIMDEEPKK
jgi:hypothetical protein